MDNRSVGSLDAPKVALREKLMLVETAERLLEARNKLLETKGRMQNLHESLIKGESGPVSILEDPYLGHCIRLSIGLHGLGLSLSELPLYTSSCLQKVLEALAESCESTAEAMLQKAEIE